MSLRIGSVYSGVLGLDLGVEAATGGHAVWTCEAAAYPRAVIAERRPGLPCFESDEEIPDDAGAIDVLIGGPPCQPTSTAGKRKGTNDDRWRWPQFLTLARRFGPRFVFVENPASLLTLADGRAFGGILSELDALGFDAEWTCLRASDVGAPHRRERMFLLAWRRMADAAGERLRESWAGREYAGSPEAEHGSALADARRLGGERLGESVQLDIATGTRGAEGSERERHGHAPCDCGSAVANGNGNGRECERDGGLPTNGESPRRNDAHGCRCAETLGDADRSRREVSRPGSHEERLGLGERRGAPANRQAEPGLGRDADGLSRWLDSHRWPAAPGQAQHGWEPPRVTLETVNRRPRLRAIGNAVVRQQAEAAWRTLVRSVPAELRAA